MSRKGSIISSIFSSYRRSLEMSRERYTELYTDRARNAVEFYEDFLHNLIVGYEEFQTEIGRRRIHRDLEEFFGRDDIQFIAIDGTCSKDPFNDFIVFSSIAYGVRGEVSLRSDPPRLEYKRRRMDEDVSFVSYVPVPFAEILDVADESKREDFIVSEEDKVDLSSIHTSLMQLAEVYLAYEMARSTAPDRARVIVMDHSPSSILASTDVGVKQIGLVSDIDTRHIGLLGYKVGRRNLQTSDAIVAYAHPFNDELQVPSTKQFRLYNAIVFEATKGRGKPLDLQEFADNYGLSIEQLDSHFSRNRNAIARLGNYDASRRLFTPSFDYEASWWDSVRLFEDICRRLFREKDQEALMYEAPDVDDPSRMRRRWMSPNDVKFLIAIGLRALIEECWQNRVMLLGIVKDSQSRYFSRNFYGLMRHIGIYDKLDVKLLPWTDRILLEDIAFQEVALSSPWTTVEFDSAYMTLHLGVPEGKSHPEPVGVKGDVVNQERLFARSLGQFFLKHRPSKSSPLMGHVIFIDRLLQADLDSVLCNEGAEIVSDQVGKVRTFLHKDRSIENQGQKMAMYLLDTLTRNLYPEAIGYPDPLHKADWGAKTVGKRVAKIIGDSEISFKAKPLTQAFRTIRDSLNRG